MNRGDYHHKLLDAAGSGAIILTATKRLARYLSREFRSTQEKAGLKAWLAPQIYDIDSWANRSIARLGQDHRVLKLSTTKRLWEKTILEEVQERSLSLMLVPATARLAAKAHDLLTDYGIEDQQLFWGEDQQAFLRWRRRFRSACRDGNWIDPVTLMDRIAEEIRSGEMEVRGPVLLAGFDDRPPRVRRLGDALESSGCSCREIQIPTRPIGHLFRVPCRDIKDEIRAAARWARGLLEEGGRDIGIVVPELNAVRNTIESIFLEEMDSSALLALSDEERGFDLSLGAPLDRQGPVVTALLLLGLAEDIRIDEVSRLLRSPHLRGAEKEGGRRAMFDRFLRSLRRDVFPLQDLQRLLDGSGARVPALPIMKKILQTLERWSKNRRRDLPGSWAVEFSQLLHALGWPGERSLDSREFQVVQAWREKVLPEFAALDLVSGRISRVEAAAQIRQLAAELEFQPEGFEPEVQVCGVLEAGGLAFEHLWVLGLHDNILPSPPRPNPFIPVRLQVDLQMPHCDAKRESAFAGRIIERLRAAAPQVVFSHPLQEGDCLLRPSPLIAAVPPASVLLPQSRAPLTRIHFARPDLESLDDSYGPSLAEGDSVQGGTAILRDQALCPFRAFAHHRLGSRSFESAVPGLDSTTRGTLVHTVMEIFWARFRDRSALDTLTSGELERGVRECVEEAIIRYFSTHPPSPAEAILRIEKARLRKLLSEWIETAERPRPEFSVSCLEKPHVENIGGLRIRTKIDRVDILPDGRKLIIDYKTGRVSLDDLLAERLLEPQLPVYATGFSEGDLAGIAVGQLRRGDCQLKGIVRDDDLLVKTGAFAGSNLARKYGLADWDDLVSGWRSRLEMLAENFRTGLAEVNPVDFQKACRTCDQAPFCRISERKSHPLSEGREP